MANNLTLTSATFDTSTQKLGTAALSGGSGTSPTGVLPSAGGAVYTVECWIKSSSPQGRYAIAMGTDQVVLLGTDAANTLVFAIKTAGGTVPFLNTAINPFDGAWHHIAGVVGASSFALYHNGVSVGTPVTGASFAAGAATQIGIGTDSGAAGVDWVGEIDEAVVWPTAKYTSNFTPPSSPYVGNEGMTALWHLDSNGTDSATGASPTISAPAVSGLTAGGTSTISGTFANGAPTGLTYSLDSGGAVTVGSPTITTTSGSGATAVGTYSFTITTPAAAAHTISVSGTGTYAATSSATNFTTSAGGSPSISAPSVSGLTAGGTSTISGTFAAGAPTGLSQVLDGVTTAVSSPTITTTSGSGATAVGTYSYTITTPAAGAHSIQVNGTGTFAATGSPTSFTTSAGIVTILPNDAAITYSPYTWLTGAGSAKTINTGAYFDVIFTGASCSLTFDVSANTTPLPQIWYRIDGQPAIQAPIAATVVLTMPAATTAWPRHTLSVTVKATSWQVTRWATQNSAVVMTSIVLATSGVVAADSLPSKNVICYGDSITEALLTVNNNGAGLNDCDGTDALLGWAYLQRHLLGANVGVIGFGGTGLISNGQGGVPPIGTSYNLLWSGQARSFSVVPDMIVINEGTNDGGTSGATFQAAFTAFLTALLAAVPTCPVAVMRPFNGTQSTAIQASIAAVGSARLHYIDTTGFFVTTDSVDGLHPLGVANIGRIAPKVAALLAPILSPGGALPNRWTHS